MGLCAAEYAKDYAWANVANQMMEVYESLVEGKAPREAASHLPDGEFR